MNINKNNYEAFFLDYHEGNLSVEEVAALLLFVEQHPELKEAFEEFENIIVDADITPSFFADKSSLKKGISVVNQDDYFIGYIENTLNDTEKKLVADYLKQQPTAVSELEVYKKTVARADNALVFENKSRLKKIVIANTQPEAQLILAEEEYLLIAATENILTREENEAASILLKTTETKKQLAYYQQTKLKADESVVFANKEELKHETRKVVPLYYYVAVAASIALLIGFFFIFKNKDTVNLAKNETKSIQPYVATAAEDAARHVDAIAHHQEDQVDIKEKFTKKKNILSTRIHSDTAQSVMNHELTDTVTIQNHESLFPSLANKEILSQPANEELIKEEPVTIIANIPSIQAPNIDRQKFIPLNELAAEKIKEKLLDEETLLVQKQNGQLKKVNGWDIAQMLTKGVSKLSGRKLELKPKYNEDGSVSSYAFSAGEFQISKKL